MPAKQRLKIKQLYSLPNGFHCDGDGLYLNVNGDARSWVFRYRMEGKERKAGLGSLRFVTLAQARAKVFKMKQEMANGITPLELKRQTTQRIATETGTRYFKNYYQEAIENTKRVKGWTTVRTAMRWYKVIERYALPVIGNMDISVIKRDHILQILMPLWEGDPKTGEPPKVETGGELQCYLNGVFDYFISRGWCGENPARWKTGLDQFLPSHRQHPTKHHPALDWHEKPPL